MPSGRRLAATAQAKTLKQHRTHSLRCARATRAMFVCLFVCSPGCLPVSLIVTSGRRPVEATRMCGGGGGGAHSAHSRERSHCSRAPHAFLLISRLEWPTSEKLSSLGRPHAARLVPGAQVAPIKSCERSALSLSLSLAPTLRRVCCGREIQGPAGRVRTLSRALVSGEKREELALERSKLDKCVNQKVSTNCARQGCQPVTQPRRLFVCLHQEVRLERALGWPVAGAHQQSRAGLLEARKRGGQLEKWARKARPATVPKVRGR